MKKLMLLSLITFVAISLSCQAQQSPRVSAEGKNVKVSYGQPSKKGREIFGGLQPFGKVWRAGANESTEITFAKDVKFAGKDLKAGSYALFIIPNPNEWTIIINSKTKQNGAFQYETTKVNDILKVNLPIKKLDNVVEKLTYRFDDKDNLIIEWDQTQVRIPLD